DVSSEAFMDMGAWATSTLDVATAVASDVRAITGTTPEGQSIVAWSESKIIYMVLCPTLSSYARLVSNLARRTTPRSCPGALRRSSRTHRRARRLRRTGLRRKNHQLGAPLRLFH